MSIIESLRNYILTCDLLEEYSGFITLKVDYADSSQATTYNIEEVVTSNPIIKRYTSGKTKRQYLFILSSVEPYGSNEDQNIANLAFYEQLTQWIEENNKNKILPIMDDGKTADEIEVLTHGYAFDNAQDMTTCRYQIQLKLKYFQE